MIDDLRKRFREQFYIRYKDDLKKGDLTPDAARQLLKRLQEALEKAMRTNRRITIEGQESTWSAEGIEDQLLALRLALTSFLG